MEKSAYYSPKDEKGSDMNWVNRIHERNESNNLIRNIDLNDEDILEAAFEGFLDADINDIECIYSKIQQILDLIVPSFAYLLITEDIVDKIYLIILKREELLVEKVFQLLEAIILNIPGISCSFMNEPFIEAIFSLIDTNGDVKAIHILLSLLMSEIKCISLSIPFYTRIFQLAQEIVDPFDQILFCEYINVLSYKYIDTFTVDCPLLANTICGILHWPNKCRILVLESIYNIIKCDFEILNNDTIWEFINQCFKSSFPDELLMVTKIITNEIYRKDYDYELFFYSLFNHPKKFHEKTLESLIELSFTLIHCQNLMKLLYQPMIHILDPSTHYSFKLKQLSIGLFSDLSKNNIYPTLEEAGKLLDILDELKLSEIFPLDGINQIEDWIRLQIT